MENEGEEFFLNIKNDTNPRKKLGLRAKSKKLNKLLGIPIIHPVQNAN